MLINAFAHQTEREENRISAYQAVPIFMADSANTGTVKTLNALLIRPAADALIRKIAGESQGEHILGGGDWPALSVTQTHVPEIVYYWNLK